MRIVLNIAQIASAAFDTTDPPGNPIESFIILIANQQAFPVDQNSLHPQGSPWLSLFTPKHLPQPPLHVLPSFPHERSGSIDTSLELQHRHRHHRSHHLHRYRIVRRCLTRFRVITHFLLLTEEYKRKPLRALSLAHHLTRVSSSTQPLPLLQPPPQPSYSSDEPLFTRFLLLPSEQHAASPAPL